MAAVPTVRHLVRARDLADARYRDPSTVADMAEAAHLPRAHFSRDFRRVLGETPTSTCSPGASSVLRSVGPARTTCPSS